LDFHDPVYKEGSRHPVWDRPRIKHRVSSALAKYVEAHVTKTARGLIAVSPVYIDTLTRRHGAKQPAWLSAGRSGAIPFSALPHDLSEAANGLASRSGKSGPPYRIVYVGVGGRVMAKSFTLLSRVLSHVRKRSPELCEGIRIELFGTVLGWQPGQTGFLADVAAKWGIDDLVLEQPGRLSYRRSLEVLLQSDGALIFGVEDVGYMQSKLFSYALSGKPLMAIVHRDGPAFSMFQKIRDLGHTLWFRKSEDVPIEEAVPVVEAFLGQVKTRREFDRCGSIEPYLTPAMARRHVQLFEACL
jgi:hypothetical protein